MITMKKILTTAIAAFTMFSGITAVPYAEGETDTITINVLETVEGKDYYFAGKEDNNARGTNDSRIPATRDEYTRLNTNSRFKYKINAQAAGLYSLSFDYKTQWHEENVISSNKTNRVHFQVKSNGEEIISAKKLDEVSKEDWTSFFSSGTYVSYTEEVLIPLNAGENDFEFAIYGGTNLTPIGITTGAMGMSVRTTDSFKLTYETSLPITINVKDDATGQYTANGKVSEDRFLPLIGGYQRVNTNTMLEYIISTQTPGYYSLSFNYMTQKAANEVNANQKPFNPSMQIEVNNKIIMPSQPIGASDTAAWGDVPTSFDTYSKSFAKEVLIPLKSGSNNIRIITYAGEYTYGDISYANTGIMYKAKDSFKLTFVKDLPYSKTISAVGAERQGGSLADQTALNADHVQHNGNRYSFYNVNVEKAGWYDVTGDAGFYYLKNSGNTVYVGSKAHAEYSKTIHYGVSGETNSTLDAADYTRQYDVQFGRVYFNTGDNYFWVSSGSGNIAEHYNFTFTYSDDQSNKTSVTLTAGLTDKTTGVMVDLGYISTDKQKLQLFATSNGPQIAELNAQLDAGMYTITVKGEGADTHTPAFGVLVDLVDVTGNITASSTEINETIVNIPITTDGTHKIVVRASSNSDEKALIQLKSVQLEKTVSDTAFVKLYNESNEEVSYPAEIGDYVVRIGVADNNCGTILAAAYIDGKMTTVSDPTEIKNNEKIAQLELINVPKGARIKFFRFADFGGLIPLTDATEFKAPAAQN